MKFKKMSTKFFFVCTKFKKMSTKLYNLLFNYL